MRSAVSKETEIPEPEMPEEDGRPRPRDVVYRQLHSPLMVILAVLASIALLPLIVELCATQPERYGYLSMLSNSDAMDFLETILPYIEHYGMLIGAVLTLIGAWMMVYPSQTRVTSGTRLAACGVRLAAEAVNAIVWYCGAMVSILLIEKNGHLSDAQMSRLLVALVPVVIIGAFAGFLRFVAKLLESMSHHAKPGVFRFEKYRGKALGIESIVLAVLCVLGLALSNMISHSDWGQLMGEYQPSFLDVVWIALWIMLGVFAIKYENDSRTWQMYNH